MFGEEALQHRVTRKLGLFLTGNQILTSTYPRDLLGSVLALPSLLHRALSVFQVYRKDGERLKPLPSYPEGCEDETGHTMVRSSLLRTACVSTVITSACHLLTHPGTDSPFSSLFPKPE